MSDNPLVGLLKLGQSFWYDNISRDLIGSGELKRMIDEDGMRGVTSNPSIFFKSIKGSDVYDEQLRSFPPDNGMSDKDVFYELAIKDIQDAADLLLPVYQESKGSDGFVSMEVDPSFAYKIKETIKEAEELYSRIKRPNLMIKVPATKEGLFALTELISKGINVNVTLLFSVKRYEEVTHAYLQGLEKRLQSGEAIGNISSVASFFVSRVDSLTDKLLSEVISSDDPDDDKKKAKALLGKTAVANAKIAYQVFKNVFSHDRYMKLKKEGASVQRLLWASTSTKSPEYSDLLYVDSLIGPSTVNTMPPNTLVAFRDHGKLERTVDRDIDDAYKVLNELEELEINIEQITEDLEDEGVRLFREAFDSLISLIGERRQVLSK
ncbi:MAG: transaldolase [Nitrospirota bacterium]|nr:MAG: transaldolase [Nitrospirota bacterium]